MRREVRRWRKGIRDKEKYREEKKRYEELCERKKKEEVEEWEKIVRMAKTESQVWEIVNKERSKYKGGSNEIDLEEWKEYFKKQLG